MVNFNANKQMNKEVTERRDPVFEILWFLGDTDPIVI